MALKHNCVKPETGEPYIKSLTGGKGFTKDVWQGTQVRVNDARDGNELPLIEFLQSGQQIIANLEFANEEDGRFYVTQDQVHIAFVKKVSPYIAKANVLRFEPGVL